MSGIDPLRIGGRREFLGSNFQEWIIFIFSILGVIFVSKIFFLLSMLWIENFGFWLIDKTNTKKQENKK